MNILLYDKPQSELLQISPLLKANGHDLMLVSDESSALSSVEKHGIEFMMVAVRGADDTLVKVISDLKLREAARGLQVALIGKDIPDDFLVKAYDAGADGDIRIPFSSALLLSRLRAFGRRRSEAAAKVAKSPANAESATPAVAKVVTPEAAVESPPAASGDEPIDVTARSRAWKNAFPMLQDAASKFLTLPVVVKPYTASTQAAQHACRIMLSNARDQLEMRIAISADAKSATDLAVHLFGPEGAELAPDMMSELSNILMGAMKAGFAAEEIPFTGGLPEELSPEQVVRPSVIFKYQTAIELHLGEATIVVHIGMRSKANLFVSSNGLREGMVIAKDIYNARGLMVLKEGTRLSQNMIDHLRKFMTVKSTVEVMAP